jgi:hypothetical protein
MNFVGWLLGIENVASIDDIDVALAAPWAQESPFWLLAGVVTLGCLSIGFYRLREQRGSIRVRTALGVLRGVLLSLLLVTLSAPVLRLTVTSILPPTLMLIFDGTDSMAIEDPWSDQQRAALLTAVGSNSNDATAAKMRSRTDFLKALLRNEQDNLFQQLQGKHGARLDAFVFDGHSTSHLRRLSGEQSVRETPRKAWSDQLTTSGQVSAFGAVLDDIRRQTDITNLAGVVMFSDFSHNSGTSPLSENGHSPIRSVGVPIYTVGCGAVETLDLAVELQVDPKMKKAERTSLVVKLRQTGLTGQAAAVRVVARPLRSDPSLSRPAEIVVGEKIATLTSNVETSDFSFTPQESGLFEFEAMVEPQPAETVRDNNRASRQINIIDDYLRLMFVAYEPDWEWRFVKEVFHRDKLVGMNGFRTYLGSSDPRVRESNVLFLETLTPKRAEFFANDVLFLGDIPAAAVTNRFGELVKEFVGNLGGGLVVMAGPRFGPRELSSTAIADMLPIVVDPNSQLKDRRSFQLQRTAHAPLYQFMKLGETDAENEKAWSNLSEVPWYQPVAALHEQATVLAEHPSDKCADGKTPQPIIAVRQYGKGEVVYLGFNEVWRLRRKYGEKYYRQFWSQLIYRLGMSHALGDSKRFVPRIDRPVYRVDDKVTLSIEAYDENYEALDEADLPDRGLKVELIAPARDGAAVSPTHLVVPLVRSGLFETRFPVYRAGQYTLRLEDPVTRKTEERLFEVTDSSAERRRVVRDVRLQEEIALQSEGRSYDLTNVGSLVRDIKLQPVIEKNTRIHRLWSTPLWFGLIVGLMVSEWLARKMLNMQ